MDPDKHSGLYRANASVKLSDLKAVSSHMHANHALNDNTSQITEPLFDLQGHSNPVLGKHITLRMDRAGDLKRKRRHNLVLPPTVNLQQR